MRRSEYTDEQIIEAVRQLQEQGRRITGFGISQILGGGNPKRLFAVWEKSQEGAPQEQDAISLPDEVESKLASAGEELAIHLRHLVEGLYRQQQVALALQEAEVNKTRQQEQETFAAELEEAQRAYERLLENSDRQEQENEELKQALELSRSSSQALSMEVGAYRAEQQKSAEEAATLSGQLQALKAELSYQEKENKQLVIQLNEKEIELARQQERTQANEHALQRSSEQQAQLQERLNQEQQSKKELEIELAQTQERISGLKDSRDELRGRIEQLQAERQHILEWGAGKGRREPAENE